MLKTRSEEEPIGEERRGCRVSGEEAVDEGFFAGKKCSAVFYREGIWQLSPGARPLMFK